MSIRCLLYYGMEVGVAHLDNLISVSIDVDLDSALLVRIV